MESQDFQHDFFNGEITSTLNNFLERQRLAMNTHKSFYHPHFLEGFEHLFTDSFCPRDLEEKLAEIGWVPKMVDGYLTGLNYFEYLNRKEVPINVNIRPGDQIEFALFPDMVHDIMGHCPMLFNKEYVTLLEEVSSFICSIELEQRDVDYLKLHRSSLEKRQEIIEEIERAEKELKQNPTPYYYHTNLALWTIEFGLLQDQDITYAYGAALVASPIEMGHISSGKMPIVQLSDSSVQSDVNVSDLQNCLYATPTFENVKERIMAFPVVH